MSRIDQTFKRLRKKGQAALIPFVVAGDPDLEKTEALIFKMAESGADIIELGVPYSNPLADGPTIQAAHRRALENGIHLREIFQWAERWKGNSFPLVLTTYSNPVFRYGIREFTKDCKKSGVDGVIIPDLPPEEAGQWIKEARESKLDTIFLITPTSPPERIGRVSKYSRGFSYYVSITGVTGIRGKLPEEMERAVTNMRDRSRKPVAVGFGISTPEQVKDVSRFADGVIVGSAIVKIIEDNLESPDLVAKVGDFVSSLGKALEPSSR